MRVNQLAKKIGVTADTVRYYTRIGILKPLREAGNGYKHYSDKDCRRLHFVLRAKKLGFTVTDIQQIIKTAEGGDTPCPMVREIIYGRIDQAKQELKELQLLYKRMQEALEIWQEMPDQHPTGDSICALIEQWDLPKRKSRTHVKKHGA